MLGLSPDRSTFSVASYPGVLRAPLGMPGYEASYTSGMYLGALPASSQPHSRD